MSTKNIGDDVDIQRVQFDEPLSRRTLERETQEESQLIEVNEALPVKRLDGEVTRLGKVAFAGGMYCEIWVGRWKKGGEREEVEEKVCLRLTTFILLTQLL